MSKTFGEKLKFYRNTTQDPQRGKPLTQARFAELLAQRLGTGNWPYAQTISHWELNKYRPDANDRHVLLGIVAILRECGGLASAETANKLLTSGGYAPLTPSEEEEAYPRSDDARSFSGAGTPCVVTTGGTKRVDWGEAADVSQFVGRAGELSEVEDWIIAEGCRVVAVLGLGGIGKTALATKVARAVQGQFESLIWRTLRNAPPIEELLEECILFLSENQENDLPERVDKKITLLIEYLREERCLVILDNVETILQEGANAGHYRVRYEAYGQLIQRVGQSEHQSCLLLTSREKPREIGELEGESSPVRSLQLLGLSAAEGQQILADKGLSGDEEEWLDLNQRYSGNPLVLNIIAEMIREVCDGNIRDYLSEAVPPFGRIEEVLKQQFERLSALEQSIMLWLAIERAPVEREQLRHNLLAPISTSSFIVALRSLRRRSLIEKTDGGFTLQNVVMEYITNQLIEQVYHELLTDTLVTFNSHALIKAQSKEYIRQSQTRLILEPIAQRLESIFGSQERLTNRFQHLLSAQRTKSKSGYVAGNILNLLSHLNCKVSGLDFSHLAVWQAHLSGVNLQDVNFAYADLADVVFTQTLNSIISVGLSNNGQLLAAGTTSGKISVWQVAPEGSLGKHLFTFEGHTNWVQSVAFAPDGCLLASASSDHTLRLWDVRRGTCLKILRGHNHRVMSVAISPDGCWLISGSADMTLRLWEMENGNCTGVWQAHSKRIESVAISPDGGLLASGSVDSTVRLWDVRTRQCLYTLGGHSGQVRSVAFSSDGCSLASGSQDKTVRLWDISTGDHKGTLQGHSLGIKSVVFSPDGQRLVSGSEDKSMRLWDLSTERCLKTFNGHSHWVLSVTISQDGRWLASGSDDQTVRLWDVTSGQCLKTWQSHTDWVRSVAFSPDGNVLVAGNDSSVSLWDVRTGLCLKTLRGHTHRVRSVCVSPDGRLLTSGNENQSVLLWDMNSGECLGTLQGHFARLLSLAFAPDGKTLVTSSADETVWVWDIPSGKYTSSCMQNKNILQGHSDSIWSVAISLDGRLLASGSEDKSVRLWDLKTGHHKSTLWGHSDWVWSVALSPDGQIVASGSEDTTVRLWNVKSTQCLHALEGHSSRVRSVAFSPDGHILASGSGDQTVRLWDVTSGQCLKVLRGHTARVRSVAISPNAQIVASGSDDGTIKLWHLQTGECKRTLRAERPYERMNITGVRGLTTAQKASLLALGAVENGES